MPSTIELSSKQAPLYDQAAVDKEAEECGALQAHRFFLTLIRIWMRSRYGLASAWQAAHPLPGKFGGAGKSAQHAAWQVLVAFEQCDHLQSLLALVEAFERVPYSISVRCANCKGYPIVLLRLSFGSYRMARSVGVGGVYSRAVIACRGITAG